VAFERRPLHQFLHRPAQPLQRVAGGGRGRRAAKLPGNVPAIIVVGGPEPILTTVAQIGSCGRAVGYDGGMDGNAKRPWYRLHWGTVLVVFFVGMGWLSNSFSSTISTLLGRGPYLKSEGWPILCLYMDGRRPVFVAVDVIALTIDAGVPHT